MKIRRIDNQDVLNYAKKFEVKKTHRHAVSELFEYKEPLPLKNFHKNSAQLELMEMKNICDKERKLTVKNYQRKCQTIFITNEEKKPSTLVYSPDQEKIFKVKEKMGFIYNKLSELYKQNEQKLASIFIRHIKQELYIYTQELFMILRSVRLHTELNEQVFNHPFPQKLLHEINKFHEFLENFYQEKCLRQIEITEENILQKEKEIRDYTGKERYKTITKNFCPKLITNEIDIVEEFRLVNAENSKKLNKVQSELFNKLRSSEKKMSEIFNKVCEEKENDLFEGRKIMGMIK